MMRGIHSSRRIKSWREKGLNNYWLIQIHNCSQPILQTRYLLYLHVQYILIPPLQAQSSNNDIYWRIGPGHGEADADTLHLHSDSRGGMSLSTFPQVLESFHVLQHETSIALGRFYFHVLLGTSRISLCWILGFHLRVEVPFLQKFAVASSQQEGWTEAVSSKNLKTGQRCVWAWSDLSMLRGSVTL